MRCVGELTYDTLDAVLVDAIPEFRSALDEHLRDHDGEVFQHVLLGDFTRFVLAARDRGDHALVDRCLAVLELAAQSPRPRMTNLVAVSFVENVAPWEPHVQSFVATWPDGLRRMAVQQGWDGKAADEAPGPPDIDVYARVEERNPAVVESFLEQYMVNWRQDAAWLDDEPVARAFARAYGDPGSSFVRYRRPTALGISSVAVAFGRDGSTVLGLSVHGEANPVAENQANGLLDELLRDFPVSQGGGVGGASPA